VQDFGGKQPIEQTIGGSTIGHLAAGQQEGDRATASVNAWIFVVRPPREVPLR